MSILQGNSSARYFQHGSKEQGIGKELLCYKLADLPGTYLR